MMDMRAAKGLAAIAFLVLPVGCGDEKGGARPADSAPAADARGGSEIEPPPSGSDMAAQETVTIISPADRCVLPLEAFQLLVLAGDGGDMPAIRIDGQPVTASRHVADDSWRQAQNVPASSPSASTATAGAADSYRARLQPGQQVAWIAGRLMPGKHAIEADAARIEVFVRDGEEGGSPADWPKFKLHPPPSAPGRPVKCASCHAVNGEALGRARTPDACFMCHDKEEFAATHMHRIESLKACQMCHDPHGSTSDKALLRADPQVLCTKCHEGV